MNIKEQIKAHPSENIGQLEFLRNTAIEMIAALEHDISISIYDGEKGHDPEAEKELEQWKSALMWLEHLRNPTKMIPEDLEQEVKRYWKEEIPVVTESYLYDIARHFAEWGAEHLK